ncbi:hypothetical protein MF406_14375 [Georgenia sp. TF02-10]|uniref:hypothetical protein n=1 Tax=Georgenia sp. TF02-10 TaxID=2917725 RepID=UPI001FA793B0|nr:hypothetical protein [Georgenia sp. TF02-10]UNX54118.1 hypothetical protein MF406_14375 [Georgenia sp. TF02-10]
MTAALDDALLAWVVRLNAAESVEALHDTYRRVVVAAVGTDAHMSRPDRVWTLTTVMLRREYELVAAQLPTT